MDDEEDGIAPRLTRDDWLEICRLTGEDLRDANTQLRKAARRKDSTATRALVKRANAIWKNQRDIIHEAKLAGMSQSEVENAIGRSVTVEWNGAQLLGVMASTRPRDRSKPPGTKEQEERFYERLRKQRQKGRAA